MKTKTKTTTWVIAEACKPQTSITGIRNLYDLTDQEIKITFNQKNLFSFRPFISISIPIKDWLVFV